MSRPQLYIIRGPDGHPEAIHQRTDHGPKDKSFTWWSAGPDGQPVASLQGRPVESLPLFGSQHAPKWDTTKPVFMVEGERATLALANAGHRALGTVCGAAVTPGPGPLAILIGLHVILWADADESGRRHMQRIAAAVAAGVASLRWADWPDAPAAGDAADYLAAGLAIEDLNLGPVPVPEPTTAELIDFAEIEHRRRSRPSRPPIRSESPIERFNASVTVSDVLARDFALQARPGRAVRCVFHDDKHPSLSILADDRRVFCHSPACWANNDGRGRDAWDLAHAAPGEVAR